MNTQTCPACNSSNLTKQNIPDTITDNFGSAITFQKVEYTCQDCESSGDFFEENEIVIEKAYSDLNELTVQNILRYFSENNISFAAMERILGLSQRTLTKWNTKATTPTAIGVALLKFLKTFPWLLDVAEAKFEYSAAQKIHMEAFFKSLLTQTSLFQNYAQYVENAKLKQAVTLAATSMMIQSNINNIMAATSSSSALAFAISGASGAMSGASEANRYVSLNY